jgi:putative transposase
VQDFRRFGCRDCGRRYNERTGTVLNRVQVPTDIVFLVVFWRLRYKLSLRDLAEMFLIRGIVFTHEAVRDWEAKLAPRLAEGLRKRRAGKVDRCWHVDETWGTAGNYLLIHRRRGCAVTAYSSRLGRLCGALGGAAACRRRRRARRFHFHRA